MPVMNGLAAAREIRQILPKTKIVFLTAHDTPAMLHGTHSMGAWIRTQIRCWH